jgi:hypothetical protein
MDRALNDAELAELAELAIPSGGAASAAPAGFVAVPTTAAPVLGAPSPAPSVPLSPTQPYGQPRVQVTEQADDSFDYGDDAIPDDAAIAKAFADLDRMTLAAERLTEQRKKAEEQLQKLKNAEEQLLNKDIPDLLARMRLEECTTASGVHVKVKREIRASLPGHDRVEARMGAFRWLIDNGHGGVIKNQVSVALDRGEDTRADELVVELRAKGFDVESKKDVHASTLSALIREVMANGKIVPRENINVFDQRIAKLARK